MHPNPPVAPVIHLILHLITPFSEYFMLFLTHSRLLSTSSPAISPPAPRFVCLRRSKCPLLTPVYPSRPNSNLPSITLSCNSTVHPFCCCLPPPLECQLPEDRELAFTVPPTLLGQSRHSQLPRNAFTPTRVTTFLPSLPIAVNSSNTALTSLFCSDLFTCLSAH